MDNFDSSNLNLNNPLPLNEDNNKPIPFDNAGAGGTGVSHAPLDLGGTSPVKLPKAETPKIEVTRPITTQKPAENIVSVERITGIKTFFTKLHPGALNFLDEQITKWLHENPGISIKRTNIVTGMIQGKKTDPNIIISVWY